MEPKLIVAGIDVHKKMLAVVVVDDENPQQVVDQRKFGSGAKELRHLSAWLGSHGVSLVVMESTAQYWRPYGWPWKETLRCIWRRRNPTRPRAGASRISWTRCGWRGGFWRRSCD